MAPSDNIILDSTSRPSFSWQGVSNATRYEIQVDNSSSFNPPEYQSIDSNTNSTPGRGLSQGEYYWRVRAINEYGTPGEWSSLSQFVISIKPEAPRLVNPENNDRAFAGRNITFEWRNVSNAARYQVEVDNNSSFGSPEQRATLSGDDLQARFSLSSDTYSWRVRAINRYNTFGPWSAPRTLIVVPPLAAPRLVSPANKRQVEATRQTFRVIFDWNGVTGGSLYRIQIDDSSDFDSREVNGTTTATQATVRGGLLPENLGCGVHYLTYYWRVRAINQYEMVGPWSSTWILPVKVNVFCVE